MHELGLVVLGILVYLAILVFIVVVHEYGHYYVARYLKVKITHFSIGFGKTLVSKMDSRGVVWQFNAIPLGGYVKFAADENNHLHSHHHQLIQVRQADCVHFDSLHPFKKILIAIAGPFANFILSFVGLSLLLFSLYSFVWKDYYVAKIQSVNPNSYAASAGLESGDILLAFDSYWVGTPAVVFTKGNSYNLQLYSITYGTVRSVTVDTQLPLDSIAAGEVVKLGLNLKFVSLRDEAIDSSQLVLPLTERIIISLRSATAELSYMFIMSLKGVGRLLRLDTEDMKSPVYGAKTTHDTLKIAEQQTNPFDFLLFQLLRKIIIFSFAIGCVNLLLPMLPFDGGVVIMAVLEWGLFKHRMLYFKIKQVILLVGVAFVLCLFGFLIVRDIIDLWV